MKPPAFQLYADDFIAGTLDMDDAEVGLYIRLLCIQWSKGSIPAATDELMRFSRGSTTLQAERVKKKFQLCEDGELRNQRLEVVREEQQEWRRKSSEGGKKSAEARKLGKGGSRVVQPPHPLPLQPNGNTPVSGLRSPPPVSKSKVISVGEGEPPAAAASPTPPLVVAVSVKPAEAFGGDATPAPAVPTVPKASQGPKPPKLEGIPGTNKPTMESALKWFAFVSNTTDERFAVSEIKEAYRLFEASIDQLGNWTWGRRSVGDWRAAMMQRMLDQREKRGGRKPAISAADAAIRAINGVRVSQSQVEND